MLRHILIGSLLSVGTGVLFLIVTPNQLSWTVLLIMSSIFFGAATAALLWLSGRAKTRLRAVLGAVPVILVTVLMQTVMVALTFTRLPENTDVQWYGFLAQMTLIDLVRTGLPGVLAAILSAWTIGHRSVVYVSGVVSLGFVLMLALRQADLYLMLLPVPLFAAGFVARVVRRSDPLRRLQPALLEGIPTSLLCALVPAGGLIFGGVIAGCKSKTVYCASDEIFRGTEIYRSLLIILAVYFIAGLIGGAIGALTVRRARVSQNL